LSLQDLHKLATCRQLHYLGVMNTIRNLLNNIHNIFCSTCELLRYALTFLWAILCSRAVLAAKLLAVESQLAACKHQIASKKHPRPRFTPGFRLLWVVLSKSLDKWEYLVHLMQPATVKKWHNTAFRYFWRWKLRGMKRHLYEGGIRVPGLIRWPRGIKAPIVSDEPVSSVDFLPTLCELSGTAVPGDRVLDGVSIVPIFEGKGLNRTRPLCWNINFTGVPNMAMRAGDEVLLGFAEQPKAGQSLMEWIKSTKLSRFELYNLRTDLSQRIDLASEKSAHLESLIKQMNRIWLELQHEGPTWPQMGRIKPAVGKVW